MPIRIHHSNISTLQGLPAALRKTQVLCCGLKTLVTCYGHLTHLQLPPLTVPQPCWPLHPLTSQALCSTGPPPPPPQALPLSSDGLFLGTTSPKCLSPVTLSLPTPFISFTTTGRPRCHLSAFGAAADKFPEDWPPWSCSSHIPGISKALTTVSIQQTFDK